MSGTHWPGQSFGEGRFVATAQLDEDPESITLRARDHTLRLDVVLKLLRRPDQATPIESGSEQDESLNHRWAAALTELNLPHTVPVLDQIEEQGERVIVLPYLAGGNLADRIRRPRLANLAHALDLDPGGWRWPWSALGVWLPQIAEAVDAVASAGLGLTGGLPPHRVLFDKAGHPYLQALSLGTLSPPDQPQSHSTSNSNAAVLSQLVWRAITGLESEIGGLESVGEDVPRIIPPELVHVLTVAYQDGGDQTCVELARSILDTISQILHASPSTVDDSDRLTAESKELRRRGEWAGAIERATAAILANPFQPRAHVARGLARQLLGDVEGAIHDLTDALRLDREDFIALSHRGNAFQARADSQLALADFAEALRLEPSHVNTYLNRGWLRIAQRDFDAAIADFTHAVRLRPDLGAAYAARGFAFNEINRPHRALADLNIAAKLLPEDPVVLHNRAVAHRNLGNLDEAMANATQAIHKMPRMAAAHTNRGIIRNRAEDHVAAVEDFSEALRLNPHDCVAWEGRGFARNALGDYEQALGDLKEALRIDPSYAAAHANLGFALSHLRRDLEAIDAYTRAIKLQPKDSVSLVNRAKIHQRLGDTERAIADLGRAAKLDKTAQPAYLEWMESMKTISDT